MRRDWTTSGPELHLALAPNGPRRAALEHALREAVRTGQLATGTRLPSTRALAGDLALARGTVVEAYAQLTAEGYLDGRRGSGTFVASITAPAPPAVRRAARAVRPVRFDLQPGTPDLTAFPRAAWTAALRSALRSAPAASFGYGDPRGLAGLRVELAHYLARARGVAADPELIVVCGGFRHGLALIARALRARGARRIALEDPTAAPHREAVAAAGLELVHLPVDERGARTDLLAGLRVPAAVLAPAHQFPLGAVLHGERRAAAVAWARGGERLLVEDDYDAELRYDRQPVGALQALAPDRVAYGGTTSKTLAPGLRLGWLVVPPQLIDALVALRAAEDVHVPVTEQLAFGQLLASGGYERHVRRMRARYRARRDRLVELLARRAPTLVPLGISAGLGVVLELPDGGPDADAVIAEARRRSLRIESLASYHADGRGPRQGLVIGYGALPEHDVDAGLEALGDLFAATVPS